MAGNETVEMDWCQPPKLSQRLGKAVVFAALLIPLMEDIRACSGFLAWVPQIFEQGLGMRRMYACVAHKLHEESLHSSQRRAKVKLITNLSHDRFKPKW